MLSRDLERGFKSFEAALEKSTALKKKNVGVNETVRCCIQTTAPPPLLITVLSSLLAQDSTPVESVVLFRVGAVYLELLLQPTCCLSQKTSLQFNVATTSPFAHIVN